MSKEKFDPLDTDETILNFGNSLGDMPTMRLDQSGIGRVDRYELLEKLGEGGFGAVYGAKDTEAGILVALKSLPSEISCDADEMASIRDNFALVSRLSHPNIAGLKHLHKVESPDSRAAQAMGIKRGDYLVVMEYAPGATLFNWRRAAPGGTLLFYQALGIIAKIADALDYAHSQRVLHRDIKPKNVMVSGDMFVVPPSGGSADGPPEGGTTNVTVKVLDFGLAAEIRSSMSRKSKEPQNSKSGTPNYMAPEQWKGTVQNAATDQYALAVMLYELLSGTVPFKPAFDTGNFEIMRNAVCNEAVLPIPELMKKHNAVLLRALSKDPAERFGSCGEFVEALAGKKVYSPRNTRKGAKGEWPQKSGKGAKKVLVGFCALAVIAAAYVSYRSYVSHATQQQQAAAQSAEVQAQVVSLMREAQTALAGGDLDGATEKAQAVLKLSDTHAEATALLLEVEAKAGERRTREVKIDAELAVEKLEREITDLGQGLGEKLENLKRETRIAQDAYSAKSWGQAFTAFKKVMADGEALRTLDADREGAKAQRTAAENKQKSAKSAKADELAGTEWAQAIGVARSAAQSFEKGRFQEAAKEWKDAVGQFEAALTLADAVTAYRKAKQDWEDLTAKYANETRKELQQYAAAEWEAAEKAARLGAECAHEPLRGKQHYETAVAKLAEAVKKTEPFLVPQVRWVAVLNGKEVPAELKIGGKTYTLPVTLQLEKDQTYPTDLTYSGCKSVSETLLADWAGLKEKRIALEKWSGPEEGKAWTSPVTGMEFVWISALKSWVGKYEVTNGEYRKKEPGHDSKDYKGNSLNGDRQPVVYVNFDDAVAYAKWLTERDRAAGHIPEGYAYRLPTKDEFTAFVQCGDGREYPWGNEWPPLSGRSGNYCGQETKGITGSMIGGYSDNAIVTCNVEQSWANPWGLYGVGGNVWECTTATPNGAFDAWRGASWGHSGQGYLRCSVRVDYNASYRGYFFGFRLVLFRPGQR